jgi:hypothetical protein
MTTAALRPLLADLAWVFGWQPSEIKALAVEEALAYHRLAGRYLKGGASPRRP